MDSEDVKPKPNPSLGQNEEGDQVKVLKLIIIIIQLEYLAF